MPFAPDVDPDRFDAHICAYCYGVMLDWVRWQNERGMQHYFCDNECLTQWIQCGLDTICQEIAVEHRAMLAAMREKRMCEVRDWDTPQDN
jgi:hypothetical protein